MRIVAVIPDTDINSDASNWWRIIRPLSALRVRDHDVSWIPVSDISSICISGAVVILHRIIPNEPKRFIKDLQTRGAKCIIYSLDDNTIEDVALRDYLVACGGMTSSIVNTIIDRVPRQLETIALCQYVITSTQALAQVVLRKLGMSAIVLPNAIDESWFLERLQKKPRDDFIRIGWAGGRRPDDDLQEMALAWNQICTEFADVRFVVGGWQPDIIDRNIDLDKKIRIPWVPLDEWPKSMQVDIGCCPLADTTFNQSKSEIKCYEYTLAGAVVVASPVVYNRAIYHCSTGFIAITADDWYVYLSHLIHDTVERRYLLQGAQHRLHNYTSLDATIEMWELQFDRMSKNENPIFG